MIAFLAVATAARAQIPDSLRVVLRLLPTAVDLATLEQTLDDAHEPPTWLDPNGVPHSVYYDGRFGVEDAALAGAVLSNLSKLPSGMDTKGNPKGKATLLAEVRAAYNLVLPDVPEGEDPFAYTLAANGAPVAVKMYADIPYRWSVMEQT